MKEELEITLLALILLGAYPRRRVREKAKKNRRCGTCSG